MNWGEWNMSHEPESFSRRVKNELSQAPCSYDRCQQIERATAFFSGGRYQKKYVELSTAHEGFATRLEKMLSRYKPQILRLKRGREQVTFRITDSKKIKSLNDEIDEIFGQKSVQVASKWPMEDKQAFLRSLFLTCGSIGEPQKAYHLELAIRRDHESSPIIRSILRQLSIHNTQITRDRYVVLYIKEGQHLADYLLLSGAHRSLLGFESLRVEKEMRNTVNRVVNCDSANMQRVADASARQLDLIRRLYERSLDGLLPPDLKEAAEVRSTYPDLTLKELGECLNPPLGKSGMNHRLKRMEKIAAELLQKDE
jgi:cell division protein WhiA